MNNTNTQQVNDLLNEILMKPSNEVMTERFSSEGADCTGKCTSGTCMGKL